MKIKILGLRDESYVNKTTNAAVNQVRIYFAREKVDGVIGSFCDSAVITERRCATAVGTLQKLGDKAIGKDAFLSKDTSEFKGQTYSFVDDFEFLS